MSHRPLIEILYRDDHIVAVMKPAGLSALSIPGEDGSAIEYLSAMTGLPWQRDAADPRLRAVHRLDRDTSGVLLFALDGETQRHLSHHFQNNFVEREYLAIVTGFSTSEHGTIDAPLSRHPTPDGRTTIDSHGRPASTQWRLEERLGDLSLLRVFPKTNKKDQIRVHLLSIGLPLAIDPLYHPLPPGTPVGIFLSQFKQGYRRKEDDQERPLISRLTLHAEKVAVIHPDGHRLEVVAPWPKDFRATINMLTKYARR
jgi:23S rRNA pseudouridine1911/1915/1917 synthase